jgi:hypothetical protein
MQDESHRFERLKLGTGWLGFGKSVWGRLGSKVGDLNTPLGGWQLFLGSRRNPRISLGFSRPENIFGKTPRWWQMQEVVDALLNVVR